MHYKDQIFGDKGSVRQYDSSLYHTNLVIVVIYIEGWSFNNLPIIVEGPETWELGQSLQRERTAV